MNVSSIVVKTKPEYIQTVTDSINAIDLCDVHLHDEEGRIIVTVEGNEIKGQMELMKQIQDLPNVFGVSLAYSYCENELAALAEQMKETEAVIE